MAKRKKSLYSKNRADYQQKRQKLAKKTQQRWNKAKDESRRFTPKRMKGYDGKSHTYQTRTDSRGRMRILNDGQVAPVGYTQGGRGYFGLKKNLRVTRDSSENQKAFGAAHRHEIMGANPEGTDEGAIDRMGQRGQSFVDKALYVNFRTDRGLRNKMTDAEAFFEGNGYRHTGRKMSKHMMTFGQDGREA